MIEYWKPFMVTCACPCTPHSPMQQLIRAQGLGERVDEIVADAEPLLSFTRKVLDAQARGGRIGVAENPLASRAWLHKEIYPLYAHEWSAYELVRMDQCAFNLVDHQGELIKTSRSRRECWCRGTRVYFGGCTGWATGITRMRRLLDEDADTSNEQAPGQKPSAGRW